MPPPHPPDLPPIDPYIIDSLMPDLTFLLDLNPEIGLSRQSDRNRMESEKLEFHRLVREGFLREAKNDPLRFCVLDAALPVAALHDEILARTRRALLAHKLPAEIEQ